MSSRNYAHGSCGHFCRLVTGLLFPSRSRDEMSIHSEITELLHGNLCIYQKACLCASCKDLLVRIHGCNIFIFTFLNVRSLSHSRASSWAVPRAFSRANLLSSRQKVKNNFIAARHARPVCYQRYGYFILTKLVQSLAHKKSPLSPKLIRSDGSVALSHGGVELQADLYWWVQDPDIKNLLRQIKIQYGGRWATDTVSDKNVLERK